jgi:hypothetical protein
LGRSVDADLPRGRGILTDPPESVKLSLFQRLLNAFQILVLNRCQTFDGVACDARKRLTSLASGAPTGDNRCVKKGKIIGWSAAVVALLIIIGAVIVFFGLDSIIRSRIEASANQSLKLKTTLQGVNLSLLNGTLALKNFQIESPEGFGSDVLFALGNAQTDVSYGELRGDPIKIDQITITKPSLVVEFSPRVRKINLQVLADNLKSEPETQKPPEPVHLVIKDLKLVDAQVIVWPGLPGMARTEDIVVPIPNIELHDIGSGPGAENGAAIKDVAMQVIAAMATKAADSDKLPEPVRQVLALQAGGLSQAIGAAFSKQMESVSKTVQEKINQQIPGDLGKDVGKTVEGGLKDLTGPFGKKKPATAPSTGGS